MTSSTRGAHVPGVHPGTVLGRYTLTSREQGRSGGERWMARDVDLEREVSLLVMAADGPHTEAALDAGRRAAGVNAGALTRILDVDTDGTHAWVAEEHHPDAQPLSELIGDGLPAEEVRRITGEVATALDAARARGLHHLTLTPDSVAIDGRGDIHVRGLATDAALEGLDDEAEDADARDAAAVVALTYAGLTGRWPLDTDGGGLPAAPRDGSGVLAPSQIVDDVPSDLDTICFETLAEGAGPDSPGDLAALVSPWSKVPFIVSPMAEESDHEPTVAMAPTPDATTPVTPSADPFEDDTPTSEIPVHRRSPADESAETAETTQVPERSTEPERPGKAAAASAGAVAASVVSAVAGGGKLLGERVGQAAGRTRSRAEEATAERRAQRAAIRESEARDRVSLGGAKGDDDLEPPAPLLPADSGSLPSREQSRAVLGIMAGLVTVATFVGCWGASNIGGNTDLEAIFGSDAESAPVQTTAPGDGGSESPSGADAQDEPIPVLSAVGYDPVGGDGEHNSEAPRVYDNNVSTAWTTEGYNSPNFGNKGGVGVVLDLGQDQTVSTATLQLPTATTVQVFIGDEPGITGTEIGRSEGKNGQVALKAKTPAKGQYVTVWFTTTAQGDDGRHRAALAEITLR